jgi:hypothetical protein
VVKPGLNDESGFSQISLLSLSLTVCGGQTAPHKDFIKYVEIMDIFQILTVNLRSEVSI